MRRHVGDTTRRGPNADDVAEVGRVPQRTAHIAAVRKRNHAASERHTASAGASTTGLSDIVWIARGTKNGIEGLRAETEFRHIRLADDNGTSVFLALNHPAVEVRNEIAMQGGTVRRADSARFVQVFHADREPVQRAEPIPFRERVVRGSGLRHQSLFGNQRDNRVDLGIQAIDLLQVRLHHFARREFFLADQI